VCGFLFAYWGVSDCFYDGLMLQIVFSMQNLVFRKVSAWKLLWHLAIVKTITSYFLANKKSHSCWLFGFMGREMALSIGKLTTD
jgi:hypothetical protein